ncbi:MAG: hypothetical protein AB7I79_11720 [Rhizobiaceae bacterium]
MRRSLTIVVALHWTALFAALAVVAGLDAESGTRSVSLFLGAAAPLSADTAGSAGLSLAFALASALFLWLVATAALDGRAGGETRDVASVAIVPGVFLIGLLTVTAAVEPMPGVYASLAAMFAALLFTHLVIGASSTGEAAGEGRLAARAMAAQAAHRAMLPRLTGRPVSEAVA